MYKLIFNGIETPFASDPLSLEYSAGALVAQLISLRLLCEKEGKKEWAVLNNQEVIAQVFEV